MATWLATPKAIHGVTVPGALAISVSGFFLWKYLWMPSGVKYAKGAPVFGMAWYILRSLFGVRLHDDFESLHKTLGFTFAYHVLGIPFVATMDPRNIEHILKTRFDNYVKGHLFRDPFTDLLGDGIFNVDGELWHHQRKTASRMFTKSQFENHIWKVVDQNTTKVLEILQQSKGKAVDMFNVMNRFTLDTIGEIGFSKNIGSLEDPSSPFLASFDYAQGAMIKRFWTGHGFPIWRFLRCFGLLWERMLPSHLKLLDEYSFMVVDDLMAKVNSGEDSSFVGLFMKEAQSQKQWEQDLQGFRRFMRDMVLNFLLAGRDTTAQALTWTFFELAQHPDVLQRAREEINVACGDAPVTYGALKRLPFLKAVLDEGLRLHPSVPMNGKLALQSDTWPDGTRVPRGCLVQLSTYAQGRCEEIWGSDASSFRPERWFERKHSSFEFPAFHAGPRECLGKRLAEMEMATLMASVIRDFDFVLLRDPKDVTYDTQLTLGCASGLPMRFQARK